MDFKVRPYQQFSGEFLQTKVGISSKIIDRLNDETAIALRAKVVLFEQELYNILKHFAIEIYEQETNFKDEVLSPTDFQLSPIESAILAEESAEQPETKPETKRKVSRNSEAISRASYSD